MKNPRLTTFSKFLLSVFFMLIAFTIFRLGPTLIYMLLGLGVLFGVGFVISTVYNAYKLWDKDKNLWKILSKDLELYDFNFNSDLPPLVYFGPKHTIAFILRNLKKNFHLEYDQMFISTNEAYLVISGNEKDVNDWFRKVHKEIEKSSYDKVQKLYEERTEKIIESLRLN